MKIILNFCLARIKSIRFACNRLRTYPTTVVFKLFDIVVINNNDKKQGLKRLNGSCKIKITYFQILYR